LSAAGHASQFNSVYHTVTSNNNDVDIKQLFNILESGDWFKNGSSRGWSCNNGRTANLFIILALMTDWSTC